MLAAVSRRLTACALLTLLLVPASRLAAADDIATESRLPSNVLVYISIPSVEDLRERFSETSFGDLINDDAMAKARAAVMEKFEEISKEAEMEIGMPLSDLLETPSGAAALAVVQMRNGLLGGVLLLDVGEHKDRLDSLLEKAEAGIKSEGKLTHSTETFEDAEITVWTNEDAPNENYKSFGYVVKDSTLIAGVSPDVVKDVLSRWDGEHNQTFAKHGTFSYILDNCQEDDSEPVIVWYLDPIGLFKAAVASAGPQAASQAAMVTGFLPLLGLDNLKGIGGVLEVGTDDYEAISRTMIYIEPPVSGVLRIFRCPPADLTPPKFIPAGIPAINGLNWDIQGAYEAIEMLVDSFTGPGTTAKTLQQVKDAPNGPGIHPKKDFLDLLSGRIYMAQQAPEDANQPKFLFLLGLKDEARMKEVVDKITHTEGIDLKTRDFNGTTIYEAEEGAAGPLSPAAAISNEYLLFASAADLLESVLRGDSDEPLARSEDYKTVAQAFPSEVSTFSFQRSDEMMEGMYKLFLSAMEGNDNFDVSVMPEFDDIREYFGLGGSYSIPDEKGVLMISFSLSPE